MRVIRAFGQENERLNISSTQPGLYGYPNENRLLSSLLTPLTYLIVNGTLLVIIWNGYISIQGGWLSKVPLIALINHSCKSWQS